MGETILKKNKQDKTIESGVSHERSQLIFYNQKINA